MKELVEKINALCADFAAEAQKNVEGNKAAGTRARKASLEIEKALTCIIHSHRSYSSVQVSDGLGFSRNHTIFAAKAA